MPKFKLQPISIDNLLVNSNNPRFEPVVNQKEAIELMLNEKNTEIRNLAEDIVQHGINPSKNLVVLKSKNNKFLTLEGNRRLVSVLLLNDPNKTKDPDLRVFFQKLKDENTQQIPKKISCIVFDKEEDARHWIVLEHTGKNQGIGIDPWDSEQKQRFLKNDSRQVLVFDFADSQKISRENVDSTNLERLLSTPSVCEMIGISFSNGELKFEKSPTKVQSNIKKIFAKMAQADFKVGDIYSKELREKWIVDTLGKNITSTKSQKTSTPKKSSKSLPKSSTRKHLIPNDCELEIHQSKINNIFRELKDDLLLDDSKKSTPNAVGVMFRVFLEACLDHYILTKKVVTLTNDTTINQKIESATKHMEKNGIAKFNQLRTIRITSSGKKTDILHIQRFHEYVHSSTIHPESDALKAKWDNLQEFFEILWAEINTKRK